MVKNIIYILETAIFLTLYYKFVILIFEEYVQSAKSAAGLSVRMNCAFLFVYSICIKVVRSEMNRLLRRFAAGAFALAVGAQAAVGSASALAAESAVSAETAAAMARDYYNIEAPDEKVLSYSEYYDMYCDKPSSESEIFISAADFKTAEKGDITTGSFTDDSGVSRDGVLLWNSAEGEVTYEFEVAEAGKYCIETSYCPMISTSADIELKMEIDGIQPYDTASRLKLSRVWVNERDIYTDIRGNQVRPTQVQRTMWQDCFFGDVDGLFSEPLFVYLEEGSHELRFSSERAQLAIESFTLKAPEKLPTYSEYAASAGADMTVEGTPPTSFKIEGESAAYKSDATLYPTYDNSSYLVSPSDPRKMVYNTLGSGNWKKALQTVTWEIPEDKVGAGGWYRIGIKARQDQIRGRILEKSNQFTFQYGNHGTSTSSSSFSDSSAGEASSRVRGSPSCLTED